MLRRSAAEVMAQVLARIAAAGRAGVVLDIDDTLIDCRYRKRRVLVEFANQTEIRRNFPREAAAIGGLKLADMRYRVVDVLAEQGIADDAFAAAILDDWLSRYFSNSYLADDVAFPGAVDFVTRLHDAGARIIYLTGRDEPGMGAGTRLGMERCGFPVGTGTEFVLKADPALPDVEFKADAIRRLALSGPLVAALENESRNLNAMAAAIPGLLCVLRETLCTPDPPEPVAGTLLLAHFV